MRFLGILFLPLLLAAQQQPPPTVAVKGRVVDAHTRQGLSGAAINLFVSSQENHLTYSDGEGRFRLEGLSPGRYRGVSLRSGYEPERVISLEVTGGEPEVDLTIPLNRSPVIAGRVLDHLGRPVTSARVSAYRKEIVAGTSQAHWRRFDSHSSYAHTYYMGVTDDRGEYRIWGLPKGEYVVVAKPSPEPGRRGFLRYASEATFYPNASTFDDAAPLDLDWGDLREGVDIRLAPPAGTRQSGRILAGGAGCRDCSVSIYRKGKEADLLVAYTRPSDQGDLLLEGLPTGEYFVGAAVYAAAGPGVSGLREILITRDADRPFVLEVSEPVAVRGRVIFEEPPQETPESPDQNPLFPQFNVVRVRPRARDLEKAFVSCRGEPASLTGEGAERTFEILVSPGLCRLDVRGPRDSYIAGMALDGRPLEKPEILIPPGGFISELTVRVRFDQGEVTGRLEEPDPTAWVFFLPTGPGAGFLQYRPGRPEADGSFRAILPPGSWNALAGSSTSSSAPSEVLRELPKLADRLRRVEVKAGQATALPSPLSLVQ